MEFYFVALILNNVMVQKELKMDSRFKRKMHFMVANQLNHHTLNQPYCDNCHSTVETVHSSLPPAGITTIHFYSARILKRKFNSKINFQKMYRFFSFVEAAHRTRTLVSQGPGTLAPHDGFRPASRVSPYRTAPAQT